MKRKTSKPPSRLRYEQAHPTVSVRVDRELYDRLAEIRAKEGKSFGDILREAVGVQEAIAEKAFDDGMVAGMEEAYQPAFDEGMRKAKSKYSVTNRCSVCGGWIVIDSENQKVTACAAMEERGWAHTRCLPDVSS